MKNPEYKSKWEVWRFWDMSMILHISCLTSFLRRIKKIGVIVSESQTKFLMEKNISKFATFFDVFPRFCWIISMILSHYMDAISHYQHWYWLQSGTMEQITFFGNYFNEHLKFHNLNMSASSRLARLQWNLY